MAIEHIKGVLERVVGPIPDRGAPAPGRIFDPDALWSRLVDEKLRPHAYVNNFTRNCLFVKVDSSVFLQEFNLRRPSLTEELDRHSGGRIKRVVFTL